MNQPEALELGAAVGAMTVYYSIAENKVVVSLMALLGEPSLSRAVEHWQRIHNILKEAERSLPDYIYGLIVWDENAFTRRCALYRACDSALLAAAKKDLTTLGRLARLMPEDLRELLLEHFPEDSTTIKSLPEFDTAQIRFYAPEEDWAQELMALESYYFENGCGKRE